MMQCVYNRFRDFKAKYELIIRNKDLNLLKFKDCIEIEIKHLCSLTFSHDEISYLSKLGIFKKDFLNYLKTFKLNFDNVKIYEKNQNLAISIDGKWIETILFEIPILAIINEVYFNNFDNQNNIIEEAETRLKSGIQHIKKSDLPIKIAEFGTRRRLSKKWHKEALTELLKQIPSNIVGTSNVLFAKEMGLSPIGTLAHEFIQAGQAIEGVSPKETQKHMLKIWFDEYQEKLAIALTDTLKSDLFFREFDIEMSNNYKGCRHDSGDPFTWCNKLITHYKNLGINPKTKTAVFSDCITFERATEIAKKFGDEINILFGIGTHITNNTSIPRTETVVKLTEINGNPVIKISDCEEKSHIVDVNLKNKLLNTISDII
jgi:nicotinate phosphoribosyltransferase